MINQEIAEKMYPQRRAARVSNPADLREVVAARIGLSTQMGSPPARQVAEVARAGYVEVRLTIETEPGFVVPASLLLPSAAAKSPSVLYVGRVPAAGATVEQDPAALARAGHVTLIVEPRGSDFVERTTHKPEVPLVGYKPYGADYKAMAGAAMLGKELVGMRVTDVLRAFDFLAGRKEVNPARIAVFGKGGRAAVAALHAALLEPRIERAAIEDGLLSYMDFVREKEHTGVTDLVIQGVLKDYDLPDLARAISPRPIWIVSPRRASSVAATVAEAQETYLAAGAAAGIRVLQRGNGAPFMSTYGEWLGAP
jgi:cephalosporin-C deacetylase-like acetyl esterase